MLDHLKEVEKMVLSLLKKIKLIFKMRISKNLLKYYKMEQKSKNVESVEDPTQIIKALVSNKINKQIQNLRSLRLFRRKTMSKKLWQIL